MSRRQALPPEMLYITRRHLPHWTMHGATYFVTFRLFSTPLDPTEIVLVRNHIRSGDPEYYDLSAATVLPDHTHMLFKPRNELPLRRIMKAIKGVTARLVNRHRGRRGSIWQEESFDRIVRDQNEFNEKLHYILLNAVRVGLTEDPWDYPGLYVKRD